MDHAGSSTTVSGDGRGCRSIVGLLRGPHKPILARHLLAVVRTLTPRGPITERLFRNAGDDRGAKTVWIRWLSEYDRPGHYRRQQPGLFARQVYMQLKSPWLMTWLSEKLGATEQELRAAAATNRRTKAAQAGAFRGVIPWERIQELLEQTDQPPTSRKTPQRHITTPRQLRRLIARLSPRSPITDRFTKQWRSRATRDGGQQERKRVWYRTQHEHWLGWLEGQQGPGAYDRKNWHRSAQFVYDHIVNPQMLVYLAEAAGVDRKCVTKAAMAGIENRSSMSSMSAAIRRVIPWEAVEEALLKNSSS